MTLNGCVKQEASKSSDLESPPAPPTSTVNTEIAAAQKIIEKMPDQAIGYSKLAVVYIRQARESGDFSLNNNAQTAMTARSKSSRKVTTRKN